MSEETDPGSADVTYLNLSKETIILEVARASYALAICTVVTTIPVVGALALGIELPEMIVFTSFLIGFVLLPAGLYFYDRFHERDLVLASLGHAMVRPAAFLYRILRGP